jgi:hypothetical protein
MRQSAYHLLKKGKTIKFINYIITWIVLAFLSNNLLKLTSFIVNPYLNGKVIALLFHNCQIIDKLFD